MAILPVTNTITYQVDASAHASEEQKGRERNPKQKEQKPKTNTVTLQNEIKNLEIEIEALQRQIIDTKKWIDLLVASSQPQASAVKAFEKQKSLSDAQKKSSGKTINEL